MCWFSLEHNSTDASAGQNVEIASRHGSNLLQDAATKVPVCVRDGATAQFQNLPLDLQERFAVGPNAVVVFHQQDDEERTTRIGRTDIVDFQNGETCDFQDRDFTDRGICMTVLHNPGAGAENETPAAENAATTTTTEREASGEPVPVLVRRGHRRA